MCPYFQGGAKKTTSAGTGGSGQFGAFVYKYKSGKIIDDKLGFYFESIFKFIEIVSCYTQVLTYNSL